MVGPGYGTLDLMVGKTFNVTNTPPLGNPNGAFGTAAFGSITTALDPTGV